MRMFSLLTAVLMLVFASSCIYRYSYESPSSSKKDFCSSMQKGEADYEGIIYWTSEYTAFIFEPYLDGIEHLMFPTYLAYEVGHTEEDRGLFRSARKFKCRAARIRFRGTVVEHHKLNGMHLFFGRAKISEIYYYKLLNESQISRILSEKSDSRNNSGNTHPKTR